MIVRVRRIRLNRQGYDSSGAYWGAGMPLWGWYVVDSNPEISGFLRAGNAKDARERAKALTVLPPQRIEQRAPKRYCPRCMAVWGTCDHTKGG